MRQFMSKIDSDLYRLDQFCLSRDKTNMYRITTITMAHIVMTLSFLKGNRLQSHNKNCMSNCEPYVSLHHIMHT